MNCPWKREQIKLCSLRVCSLSFVWPPIFARAIPYNCTTQSIWKLICSFVVSLIHDRFNYSIRHELMLFDRGVRTRLTRKNGMTKMCFSFVFSFRSCSTFNERNYSSIVCKQSVNENSSVVYKFNCLFHFVARYKWTHQSIDWRAVCVIQLNPSCRNDDGECPVFTTCNSWLHCFIAEFCPSIDCQLRNWLQCVRTCVSVRATNV